MPRSGRLCKGGGTAAGGLYAPCRLKAGVDLGICLGFWGRSCKTGRLMPGYPSKKAPPVYPDNSDQPDPSVAPPRTQRPWAIKWVVVAVVVFIVIFNLYYLFKGE